MKSIITTFLVVLSLTHVYSQESTTPYIDVKGSAETEITPNIIVYSLHLSEYEKDKKRVALEDIEARFLKAVTEAGIEQSDINVSHISAGAFTKKRKRKTYASKTYNITFSDHRELMNFTDRLDNSDINRQYISKLSHTDISEFRLKVKTRALMAAKSKAQSLLESIDASIGQPLLIVEDPPNFFSQRSIYSNTSFEAAEADLNVGDVDFKKIKLRYEIKARFAIN